ncbi:SHOCT domain-containing protein [Cellulomonas fimi]|uniref:SHOCT domain-containing protein n=1 Tax=Cellulomonas fimi TaxID=1708 RepID=A0A7Y0M134_CELFI|nr:hypothetical protein [Cellulomonas fimi]NMR20497.1 hypothetical protein [Cellulomonas fimi]
MMGYGWGMGAGGWIAMIVFWVALVALVAWLIVQALPSRRREDDRDRLTGAETAEQILDRRYAVGEIDADTYQVMRVNLASGRTSGRDAAR